MLKPQEKSETYVHMKIKATQEIMRYRILIND